jgi:tetratricopeptide (TPR) repeat protein
MTTEDGPADGREQRWGEIVAACLEARERGQAVDRQALAAAHPEFAEELAEFFARGDRFDRLAAPIVAVAKATAGRAHPDLPDDTFGEASGSSADPAVRTFGDYEVLEKIARGGMAVVYKARQVSLNRVVALKMIRRGDLGSEEEERFRHEAEMVAELDHPHIVPIYEVGEASGRHFFSMKFLEGGSLAALLGRFGADPRAFRAALQLRRPLADASPSMHRYRYQLAETLDALGALLIDARRFPEAEALLGEAVAIGKDLVDRFGGLPDYRAGLAQYTHNLARLLKETGRPEESEKTYRAAVPIHKALAEQYPEVPAYRRAWAGTLNSLGVLLTDRKHHEEAEKTLRQARDLRQRLVNERPGVAALQSDLAVTLSNLGGELVVSDRGDLHEACRLLREAIRLQEAARDKEPNNPTYLGFLVSQHFNLAQAQYFLGEHREATQTAAALPRLDPDNWEAWHRSAQCLALCLPLALKDPKLAADARQATAREYARDAMRMLRQAVARGFTDGKSLEADEAFEALRSSEEFRKLVAELKARQK